VCIELSDCFAFVTISNTNSIPPVLEPSLIQKPIVIVTADTSDYRRASVVHTCLGDRFLEIGCDFGHCIDRVRRALLESPWTYSLKSDGMTFRDGGDGENEKTIALGLDKSEVSIDIAMEK